MKKHEAHIVIHSMLLNDYDEYNRNFVDWLYLNKFEIMIHCYPTQPDKLAQKKRMDELIRKTKQTIDDWAESLPIMED